MITVASGLALIAALSGFASPADADDGDITAAAAAIRAVAPSVLADVSTAVVSGGDSDVLHSSSHGLLTTIPTDPADGIELDRDGAPSITIGLPGAARADDAIELQRGVVAYDNNDGSTTVPVVKDDGSLQVVTTITSRNAPQVFRYPLTLPTASQIA